MICGRMTASRVKGKIYKTLVRPAMICGWEMVILTKKIGGSRFKMLRFSVEVTRMDKVKKSNTIFEI